VKIQLLKKDLFDNLSIVVDEYYHNYISLKWD